MKPTYEMAEVMALLRRGVNRGWWTVEDLDKKGDGAIKHWEPVNLLREAGAAPEAVQVTSERDLPPLPHGVTPAQPDGPLTLEQEPETPFVPF